MRSLYTDRIYLKLLLSYLLFFAITFFFKGPGLSDVGETLLGASTFLFSAYFGFSMASRHHRLSSIRNLLRQNDAHLLSMYHIVSIAAPRDLTRFRNALDKYLIATLDLKMIDHDQTTPALLALFDPIFTFKKSGGTRGKYLDKLVDRINPLIVNHKEIVYRIRNKMDQFEWICLIGLASAVLVCLFALNDQSPLAFLLLPLLATTLVLLLLVLREIDMLRYQERRWIWQPISDLFKEIGLTPYFPEPVLTSGRIRAEHILHLGSYRVASYPQPYPDMTGKTVRVMRS